MLTASSGERVHGMEGGKENWFQLISLLMAPGLRRAAVFRDSMEVVEERTQKITRPALCLIQPLERVPGHQLQTAKQSKSRL